MGIAIWLTIKIETGNEPYTATLYDDNITHNLAPMWRKAGVFDAIYNSDGKQAGCIAKKLRKGLEKMKAKPEKFRRLNPVNGWGDYDGAIEFLSDLTDACEKYPNATIGVWK